MPTTSKRKYQRINPDWKEWRHQVKKLRSIIRKLPKQQPIHGPKWVTKMEHHYGEKLTALLSVEPVKYKG